MNATHPKSDNQAVLEDFLGGSLRDLRMQRGERLSDVAAATGASIESICSYEQGRAVPSIRRLAALIRWTNQTND